MDLALCSSLKENPKHQFQKRRLCQEATQQSAATRSPFKPVFLEFKIEKKIHLRSLKTNLGREENPHTTVFNMIGWKATLDIKQGNGDSQSTNEQPCEGSPHWELFVYTRKSVESRNRSVHTEPFLACSWAPSFQVLSAASLGRATERPLSPAVHF